GAAPEVNRATNSRPLLTRTASTGALGWRSSKTPTTADVRSKKPALRAGNPSELVNNNSGFDGRVRIGPLAIPCTCDQNALGSPTAQSANSPGGGSGAGFGAGTAEASSPPLSPQRHELTSSSEITSTAWTAGRRESHPTDNDRVAGERSERDIVVVATTVVRVVETSASGGGRIVVSAIVAARGSSAATAGPGENDVAGDNLRPVALVAVPIIVARSPKSPFDEQASSL